MTAYKCTHENAVVNSLPVFQVIGSSIPGCGKRNFRTQNVIYQEKAGMFLDFFW